MKIIIGSDEMILWLRKNNQAVGISNKIIGKKIRKIIKNKFGINPIEYDIDSFWANKTGDKNIYETYLPKTSAQYEIEIKYIEELYNLLNTEF